MDEPDRTPGGEPSVRTVGELRAVLREDRLRNGRGRAGFHVLAVHRLVRWAEAQPPWLGKVPARLLHPLRRLLRNVYGIELPTSAHVGRRVRFAHQGGTVIAEGVRIGDDCLIRHGVTLGAVSDRRFRDVPVLEAGVEVGCGAVIVGGITIGAGSKIGALALVTEDVPADGRVKAGPTR